MKLRKVVFAVAAFFIVFAGLEIRAQDSKLPKQIRILNNYGASIPFEDGKTIIAEVNFTGLTALPESEIFKALRENRTSIKVGDNFYGGKVAKAVKVIRERLVVAGYYKAEVTAFGEMVSKKEMKLNFVIKQGSILRVSEIRFEGNVNVSNEEFVLNFKQCIAEDWQIFIPQKYKYMTHKCSLGLLYSKGYFQARIGQITPQLVSGNYVVTVEVKEGARFRYGEIKVEGARAFTGNEILQMLGIKKGDISDGRYLIDFVYEKLKKIYADKGYVLYNAEFEPTFINPAAEGAEGIVKLDIKIDEGPQFKLLKIEFSGIEKEKARQLRELFSLKDGEVYSQSKIEEGVSKINELKKYDFVDKDRDVEIRTNEEIGDIEILVRLNEIKQ